MNLTKATFYTVICFFLITGCKDVPNQESSKNSTEYIEDNDNTSEYRDPYPEYCISGNISDINPYEIKNHDGYVKARGRNRADVNNYNMNGFFATFSHYDKLKEAGIKDITIDVKAGEVDPKFRKGTFAWEPHSLLSTESLPLPDILVFIGDSSESAFNAVSQIDADAYKQNGLISSEAYPPYIIEAASLNITHIEDIVLDESEKEEQAFQAKMGMRAGKQYVKGTISFTIKKFGPKGDNFGPATFTFASINDWAYFPKKD